MLKEIELNDIIYTVVDIKKSRVWDYVEKIKSDGGDILGYTVLANLAYYSERYKKWVGVERGDLLALQGRWFRRYTWLSTTYVFGEVKSFLGRFFECVKLID